MRARYLSLGIAAGSTLLISLLILFGPGAEKKNPDTLVLDTAWTQIEYQYTPQLAGQENQTSEPKTGTTSDNTAKGRPHTKERPEPDAKKAKASGNDNHLTKTFVRLAGFMSEEYFAHVAGDEKGGPVVRRRGNHVVRNIFSDWSKLRYTAMYNVASAEVEKYGPFEERILLTSSSGTVIVKIGRKMSSGSQFVLVDTLPEKDRVYVIAGHLSDRFRMAPASYREKRILNFPTDSFTGSIDIMSVNGKALSLTYRQEKSEKDKQTVFTWYDSAGKEAPMNLATPLDNHLKSVEIARFRDEAPVTGGGDLEKSWDEAVDTETAIIVRVKKGSDTTIKFRKPKKAVTMDKKSFVLLRTTVDSGTDYADAVVLQNIEQQISALANFAPAAPRTTP